MICAFIISNLLINDAKIVINNGINAKKETFLDSYCKILKIMPYFCTRNAEKMDYHIAIAAMPERYGTR